MHTLIIRENNHTQQVFVGEHAPRPAATWAINEILSEYTWDDGKRITETDLLKP